MDKSKIKNELTDEQRRVLVEGGTEPAFSGKYYKSKDTGMYRCAGCGTELFSSGTKFDSDTGWPSFDAALPGAVKLRPDDSYGMRRMEVVCANCGGHLGHVFSDPPSPKATDGQAVQGSQTGKRYCINSVCLDFQGTDKNKDAE